MTTVRRSGRTRSDHRRRRRRRRRRVAFSAVVGRRGLPVAAAGDDGVTGRREKAQSVAGRDAEATGVRAQPPARQPGHVALVHGQHVAHREVQLLLRVGAVGVQRLRLLRHRRGRHLV